MKLKPTTPSIAIVAGEPSGDIVAAQIISSLRQQCSRAQFLGITGPKMRAQNCDTLLTLDHLQVMGLWEVLLSAPRIMKARRQLIEQLLKYPPDIFVGIDYTDFNLSVAKALHKRGVKTVQFKSPSVWAWRRGRIKTIREACDRVLTLFPFEKAFLERCAINATFVGHPMADQIPIAVNKKTAREKLKFELDKPLLAVMPGSRKQEIHYLGPAFIKTVQWCQKQRPDIQIVAAMINQERSHQFQNLVRQVAPQIPICFVTDRSTDVLSASDAVLLASGTASLEAMLCKCPMVVAYRLHELSYQIAKRIIDTQHISLPNLLAKDELVPEFIQHNVDIKKMGAALMKQLNNQDLREQLQSEFTKLHKKLRHNAAETAAKEILSLL